MSSVGFYDFAIPEYTVNPCQILKDGWEKGVPEGVDECPFANSGVFYCLPYLTFFSHLHL
jgi:hypothetical protein